MESILNLIPAVMGLGVIDENLTKLLTAMQDMSPDLHLPSLMGYAKIIGLCIALGVGANECYQMMLGRRGIDVMKLVHIIIISLCISLSGTIASIAREPGSLLEGIAKTSANSMNDHIQKQEEEVATAQEKYIDKVRESMQQMEEAQKAEHEANRSLLDYVTGKAMDDWAEEKSTQALNAIKEYTLVLETKICEWISLVLRLIGEVILQAIIYGLLVSQRIFMHLLEMVAPLMFAISLSPHFKSAWSQWLSKYISVSLWGFVTYVCMYYVFYIISYNLTQDSAAYMKLMTPSEEGDAQVAAIGMQAIGSTCMYLIGILVGVKVLSMVPEVASWLIPGGVSSSAGSSSAGTVTAGASMIGGAAGTAAGLAVTGSIAAAKTGDAVLRATESGVGSAVYNSYSYAQDQRNKTPGMLKNTPDGAAQNIK